MAVSRRLRFEILRRDNHTCRYCGGQAPDVKLTVDHVVPVTLGGTDDPTNLVTACAACNGGKSSVSPDSPLVADVEADALRWAHARSVVIERWRAHRDTLASDLRAFARAWDAWGVGPEDDRTLVPREATWETSVERWLEEGLTVEDLAALIPKAMHSRPGRYGDPIPLEERWRYFCGVVWRTLDEVQTATVAAVANDFEAATSDAKTDEEALTEAYVQGYEQGLLDAESKHGAALSDAVSQFTDMLRKGVAEPEPCRSCSGELEYEKTGFCLNCWRDRLGEEG